VGTLPRNTVTLVRKTNGITEIGVAGVDIGMPVKVRAMPVWKMILVRVTRVYLSTFLGLVTATGTGLITLQIPWAHEWGQIATALMAATAPAFLSLCHNAVDFLTAIDVHRPELRA